MRRNAERGWVRLIAFFPIRIDTDLPRGILWCDVWSLDLGPKSQVRRRIAVIVTANPHDKVSMSPGSQLRVLLESHQKPLQAALRGTPLGQASYLARQAGLRVSEVCRLKTRGFGFRRKNTISPLLQWFYWLRSLVTS